MSSCLCHALVTGWDQFPSHHSRFTCPSSHKTRKIRCNDYARVTPPSCHDPPHKQQGPTPTLTQHWTKTGLRLHKGDAKMTRSSQAFPSLGPRLGVCCDPSHGTVTRGEHLSLSVWKMWHAPFMWKGRNTSLLQTRGSSESLFNVGKTHEWLVLCLISRWTTKGKHARTHTRGHKGCIQTILC